MDENDIWLKILKTAKSNRVLFNFRFKTAHPPGVTSTARYCELIVKMCINILLWNDRTHLMNKSRELPEI